MSFEKDFVWGVASAAYQIEGAAAEGGRGPSIWDVFSHTPGCTFEGHTGDIACDGYHRYEADIRLMASLGIKAYRFSTSWARLDPAGQGGWNEEGFAYYDRVVNCCLENGIAPYITLYHWDLPQALEEQGGWRNRATAVRFGQLAGAVAARFKGRARHYITLNEPQCSVWLGYANGQHAPGHRLPPAQQFLCWHNLLLAHGYAASALRSEDPDALVGIATTGQLCYPACETDTDIEAARRATFNISPESWAFTHHMALDPVCLGRYPCCAGTFLQPLIEAVCPADLALIFQKPDFIGLNIYNGHEMRMGAAGPVPVPVEKYPGFARTALKWPVTPEVMNWGVRFISQRYGLPIYITENGQSCNDRIFLDGGVHDADRIDFLHRYLLALSSAAAVCDVRGYFHWCWTDNYEWNSGYNERFGLVYVDYPTQNRILKDSAHWYAAVIQSGGNQL